MVRILLAVLVLSIIPRTLFAIDKGHLADIPKKHSDAVIGAFSQVAAYYLLSTDGDSAVRKYSAKDPGLKAPIRNGLTLYLDPAAADRYREVMNKPGKTKYVVKKAALSTILKAQYAAKDKPPARKRSDPPNFVVFENTQHRPLLIEYLIEEKSKSPFLMRQKNKAFVPAFVSRELAIQTQKDLEKIHKRKYVRVGQDFSTFLKTIQSFADQKLPVVVFGYIAARKTKPKSDPKPTK